MGNYVYSVHNSQDDKLYNVLGRGDLPTVVFGRTVKEHSVPGTQYYFADGKVKFLTGSGVGFDLTEPCHDKYGEIVPCIFTVPEDLDFSRMNDVEYVKQFSRSAIKLNANTVSPDFIIRDGEFICIKKDINQYVRIRYYKNRKSKRRRGNRYITTIKRYFDPERTYHSRKISVYPVGSRRPSSLSIYNYYFIQRYKQKNSYNIHGYTYDEKDNICYFRSARVMGGGIFTFRCSQFENLDGWQYDFDFQRTLRRGDYISVECHPSPTEGTYVFYNNRTENNLKVFVTSVSGGNDIKKVWRYYPAIEGSSKRKTVKKKGKVKI